MQILIVKLSSLGDVIQTMPIVHDLLQQFPGAHIDWVVEEAFAPLVQQVQGLRRVLPIAQRRWRKSRWQAATRRARAVPPSPPPPLLPPKCKGLAACLLRP